MRTVPGTELLSSAVEDVMPKAPLPPSLKLPRVRPPLPKLESPPPKPESLLAIADPMWGAAAERPCGALACCCAAAKAARQSQDGGMLQGWCCSRAGVRGVVAPEGVAENCRPVASGASGTGCSHTAPAASMTHATFVGLQLTRDVQNFCQTLGVCRIVPLGGRGH